MTISDWVQFGAFAIALITLIVQQSRTYALANKHEIRTANKLKIFYICQTDSKTEDEIIREYKQRHPTEKNIDEVEIRKTIYEMLAEETLRFRNDQTYRARRNKAISPQTNEDAT